MEFLIYSIRHSITQEERLPGIMPLVNTLLYRLGQFAYIFGAIILIRKVFLKGTEISVKKQKLIVSSDLCSFAIHFQALLATRLK